jgi:hypothetical protein
MLERDKFKEIGQVFDSEAIAKMKNSTSFLQERLGLNNTGIIYSLQALLGSSCNETADSNQDTFSRLLLSALTILRTQDSNLQDSLSVLNAEKENLLRDFERDMETFYTAHEEESNPKSPIRRKLSILKNNYVLNTTTAV